MLRFFSAFCLSFCLIFQLQAQNLTASGSVQEPLKVGTLAPKFEALDQDGMEIKSDELLQRGDIVLVFYRGAWCPHCKKHIHELQQGMMDIMKAGASVVVITPEQPEFIEKMVAKTGATFSIIHDENYKIMKDYKTDFQISNTTVTKSRSSIAANTRKHNGNIDDILPIPATYIIGKDGKIKFVHFDEDYTTRASVATILKELKGGSSHREH